MSRRWSHARPGPRPVALAAAAIVVVLAVGVALSLRSSSAPTPHGRMESIFQDDDHLLYASAGVVKHTLDQLRGLGVDHLRLTILWAAIAPQPGARAAPRGFRARDPASYPTAAWAPYDRIVELAQARGIGVAFNVTAPGPLWAMAHPAPNPKAANHYRPSSRAFGEFVAALGRRYSGRYLAPSSPPGIQARLPRVSYWTIWNEANQPGWLYPQWRAVGGLRVMNSPRLYRLYADAAFAALGSTGHSPPGDTILIGELAPEGSEGSRAADPIPPIPFIRALYCVDASYRPLRGTAAALQHCPQSGDPRAFVRGHAGLFQATGFAHHPYSFFLAPATSMSDPNFAPLADLSRLEGTLDRSLASYGVNRQLPLYLTEYGYETNPPNPFRGISLSRQSLYLNQAQYLAWRDPRVRSLAQFLLNDAAPDRLYPPGTPGYWSTFQTGLRFVGGKPKPSLNAYRLPIFVAQPSVRAGSPVEIWGLLRPAPAGTLQPAQIQWRPRHGRYRSLITATTDSAGVLSASVVLPGSGAVRIAWASPHGAVFHSRAVGVRSG